MPRRASRLVLASLCLGPLLPSGRAAGAGTPTYTTTPARWLPRLAETNANNLVPSSGFELGAAGWSSLGQLTGWVGDLSSLSVLLVCRVHAQAVIAS